MARLRRLFEKMSDESIHTVVMDEEGPDSMILGLVSEETGKRLVTRRIFSDPHFSGLIHIRDPQGEGEEIVMTTMPSAVLDAMLRGTKDVA